MWYTVTFFHLSKSLYTTPYTLRRFRIMISIIGFAHNATHTVARGWARRKAVLYRPMMTTTDGDDSRRLLFVCIITLALLLLSTSIANNVSSSMKKRRRRFACRSGKFTPSRYNICCWFAVRTWFNADGRGKSRNRQSHTSILPETEFQSKAMFIIRLRWLISVVLPILWRLIDGTYRHPKFWPKLLINACR